MKHRTAAVTGALSLLTLLLPALPVAQAAPPPAQLTRTQVLRVLGSAREYSHGATTGEHLHLAGKVITVPDGFGGTLTAVPTVRFPTADGYGQLVLFWHGRTLIGSDRLSGLSNLGEESSQLKVVAFGKGFITVRFWRYKPTDPMYAPSLKPMDVTYRWTGKGLQASTAVPMDSGNKLDMRLP